MKINCEPCMKDLHRLCEDKENCLCASDNHGFREPTVSQILMNPKLQPPKNEPMEYEKALRIEDEYDELVNRDDLEKTYGFHDEFVIRAVKAAVICKAMPSEIDMRFLIRDWIHFKGLTVKTGLAKLITTVFHEPDVFPAVKAISRGKGLRKEDVTFGSGQMTEAAYYLMGRYHIKRIDITGKLLIYNDMYYDSNAEHVIRRKAREILVESKNGEINEVLKIIEDSCDIITWSDIEQHVHLKCMLNGIYDIKGGVFTKVFSPDNIILNLIPHEYDEDHKFAEINNKVSEIIEDSNDRQSFYDTLSIALHPYTGIDFQFGGVGIPGTGKSQLCNLAEMVLGSDNVSNAPVHMLSSDLTIQLDCAFKFLNIDMDMSNEAIKNIDVLKRWITQDRFTARGIYEHATTFRPTTRLMFMANELYEIGNADDAEAIYERTHIIQLNKKFRGTSSQIKNIFEKVATKEELSGFITYLLKNATEIYNKQNIHHPINLQTVKDTWNLHGNHIKMFFENWFEKGTSHREPSSNVWSRWITFANLHNYQIKDKKKFNAIFEEMTSQSPTKTRIDGEQVWAYQGFRLLNDDEIQSQQKLFSEEIPNGASRAYSSISSFVFSSSLLKNNFQNKNKIKQKIKELSELLE